MFLPRSAAETKVPARGKALIPTDLSIAVPEGAYARIGISLTLCVCVVISVQGGLVVVVVLIFFLH